MAKIDHCISHNSLLAGFEGIESHTVPKLISSSINLSSNVGLLIYKAAAVFCSLCEINQRFSIIFECDQEHFAIAV